MAVPGAGVSPAARQREQSSRFGGHNGLTAPYGPRKAGWVYTHQEPGTKTEIPVETKAEGRPLT